jgi:ABC-type nitrate/sulfonate/bicarbonate transport system permease component
MAAGAVDRSREETPTASWSAAGVVVAAVLLAAVLAAWWLGAQRAGAAFFLPPPDAVWSELLVLLRSDIWRPVLLTLGSWAAAFAAAAVFGLGLGIAAGQSARFRAFVGPALTLFGAFSVPVVTPVLVFWGGIASPAPAVATGALLALFPMAAIAGQGGARPSAICRALEIGGVLTLAGVVFAEMIVGDKRLGTLLYQAVTTFEIARLFAFALLLWALGLLLALPFAVLRRLFG